MNDLFAAYNAHHENFVGPRKPIKVYRCSYTIDMELLQEEADRWRNDWRNHEKSERTVRTTLY